MGLAFEGYLHVYKTAWLINRAGKGKVTILNADIPVLWDNIKRKNDYANIACKRDQHMADLIENEIIKKGLKALFYAGKNHTLKNLKLEDGSFRETAIGILSEKYPDTVFSITTHQANRYNRKKQETRRLCDGLFDFIFAANNNQPVGFDLKGSPFGEADEKDIDYINAPHGLRLDEMHDGYVYLGLFEEYKHTAIIENFYNEAYLRKVADRNEIVFGYNMIEKFKIHEPADFIKILESSGVGNKNLQSISAWKRKK